jgi:hypothetical protein
MNEKQQDVLCALISRAVAGEGETKTNNNDSEGGKETMKHNVFDTTDTKENSLLVHGEQEKIIGMAKNKSVGTFKNALAIYSETNTELAHGVTDQDVVELFPEYQDVRPGTPELITRDYGWVQSVIQKAHKSPMSRIRTRQSDIRGEDMRASGYQKGKQKQNTGNMKLLKRTTDPQTLVIKDSMHRDDIIDITDFDYVNYQWGIMRGLLNEEMAISIMIGDGREEGDDAKISQEHVRSIWNDDELYTIHADIDMAAARAELQGTSTAANFGENYIRAEATITAALYAREKYKGSGSVVGYCTPHELNVMLLARDLNGRRIYDSKADLAAALNVSEIYTVEQFEGKTRTTTDNKTKKLAWIFVNMADYNIGSTKGGQITQFHDFDIDFNGEKYLLETRISGALTRVYSAIALEEDVTA